MTLQRFLAHCRWANALTTHPQCCFAAVGDPDVAVCLLPRTEIAFDANVTCDPAGLGILPSKKIRRLARYRQINMESAVSHRDALEFADGQVVLAYAAARRYCNCRLRHILWSLWSQ